VVKKFIRDPAKIIRKADIMKVSFVKGTQAMTQKGKLIRANNRAVPLNPKAPLNDPRAGNFATKRRVSRLG